MKRSSIIPKAIKKAILGVMIIINITGQASGIVFADSTNPNCPKGMSTLDCNALLGDWMAWVPDVCGQTPSTSVTLIGNDNLQKIFNYFATHGYTPEQAAGIIGNIQVESHGDPRIYEGDGQDHDLPPGPKGWGIVQWTPPDKLLFYAQPKGLTPSDLSTQIEFLWKQLDGSAPNNNEKAAGDDLKKQTTAYDAAVSFLKFYERAADSSPTGDNAKIRGSYAQQALALYGAGTPSGTAGSTTSVSSFCAGATTGVSPFCNGTQLPAGNGAFTTNTSIIYPGVANMISRACQLTDRNSALFKDVCGSLEPDLCYHFCLGATAQAWGHGSSGYERAIYMWDSMVAQGKAHAGDRNPPVGALLFYTWTGFGHVVIYLGNNLVMSTDILNPGDGGPPGYVYITDASKIENGPWRLPYLGWSPPAYATASPGDYTPIP